LLVWDERSAQAPGQATAGDGHAQAPETQVAPVSQALRQLPQFMLSLETSAQSAPQVTGPVSQAQTPLVQV